MFNNKAEKTELYSGEGRLMTLKRADAEMETRVFGLVSGSPGSGKTTQMTTFPIEETLGISVENGFLSIKGSGFAYEEVSTYDELLDVITNVGTKYPWCNYLYIDSLTEIYDVLKHELKGQFKPSQNFAKHEEMYDKLLHIIRVARDLPISVFFTCHLKEEKDGMAIVQQLSFDGKMPSMVMKQFDLCVHLEDVDNNGTLVKTFTTNPTISKVAKRRVSPWLNIKIEDYEEPNLYKLVNKLLGK